MESLGKWVEPPGVSHRLSVTQVPPRKSDIPHRVI